MLVVCLVLWAVLLYLWVLDLSFSLLEDAVKLVLANFVCMCLAWCELSSELRTEQVLDMVSLCVTHFRCFVILTVPLKVCKKGKMSLPKHRLLGSGVAV